MSKDELLELVWSGASIEEGNLAQQVLLLRLALADAGDCVATVPRYGYHFVAPVIEESDANRTPIDSPHCVIWNDHEVPLREGISLIGRAEDADLRIPLPSVSRHHARMPFLHFPNEVGADPEYAARSATGMYRTTPLRGAWQHRPYFHDGRAADFLAVVNYYNSFFSLGLTKAQKADLVAFLKSL